VGHGDDLMATGMARGAAARGKRIAFGDGKTIKWGPWSAAIFRGNPNIAPPGSEHDKGIEWIHYYKGKRIYNEHDRAGNRWVWNLKFHPVRGEMFFSEKECREASRHGGGFVLMEPNVPAAKNYAPNKDWGSANYQKVADGLRAAGLDVAQFAYPNSGRILDGARSVATESFRQALAVLANAVLYVGPEGGLHHGAAAVGIPAVVLFGGFIPPQVTGYEMHTNLTGGAPSACGLLRPCEHCRAALAAIGVDEVLGSAMRYLKP